jgi:hypothetical protein
VFQHNSFKVVFFEEKGADINSYLSFPEKLVAFLQ